MSALERTGGEPRWRERLAGFIQAPATQRFIIGVIVVNALVIGLETSASIEAQAGGLLRLLDQLALAIFLLELGIKLLVFRLRFFLNPWNVFDFAVVAIALVPAGQGLSVLRTLRILRALRLLSLVPKMRTVIEALLRAIPGMGSVIALLLLVYYIAAVVATKLFGPSFDEWFGTLGRSFYSLFQIMTLESWSMGIVRPVMEVYPYAWIFFVTFILMTTFAVMNLFIAIIVNSMHEAAEDETEEQEQHFAEIAGELRALRAEVAALRREREGAGS